MDNFAISVLLALAKPRPFDMVGIARSARILVTKSLRVCHSDHMRQKACSWFSNTTCAYVAPKRPATCCAHMMGERPIVVVKHHLLRLAQMGPHENIRLRQSRT